MEWTQTANIDLSLLFILLWLHLDFTAGLLLFLSPCGTLFPSNPRLKLISDWMYIISLPFCPFVFHLCQYWTVEEQCCCHVQSYRSHLTALTILPTLPLSVSFPGSQIYHSAVCILVQFLMLRLMGRTVTTVLSSFTFQMVRWPGVILSSIFPFSMRPVVMQRLWYFYRSVSGPAHQSYIWFPHLHSLISFNCHVNACTVCPIYLKGHLQPKANNLMM